MFERHYDSAELKRTLLQWIAPGVGPRKEIQLPFAELNRLTNGGVAPGELTVVAGWTSNGKSVFIDNCLLSAGDKYKRHLYINEQTADQRLLRLVANLADVSFPRLVRRQPSEEEKGKLADFALTGEFPFGITEAHGWTAEQVAEDIAANEYDVVGIDILNQFPRNSENEVAELDRISRILNAAAKKNRCHVYLGAHLNEARAISAQRPRPVLRDIRGTGSLKNDADYVMFVWRRDDKFGDPTPEGYINIAKGRQCQLGGVEVYFNGNRMRFEPVYGPT